MRPSWIAVVAPLLVAAPAAAQVYVPIPVTGYTDDVIADAVGVSSATTTAAFDFDSGVGRVLFEQGYQTGGSANGLSSNGLIVTSPSRVYQLGPITGNNSLRITQSRPTGTLTLVTPVRDAALSILLADGDGRSPQDGGDSSTVTVAWSNGQTSTYPYTAYDWGRHAGTFGPAAGEAIGGLDRVRRFGGQLDDFGVTFSIYYFDLYLGADPNYLAGALTESLTFAWPGTYVGFPITHEVMGLSGATAVPEPSALALLAAGAGLAACWRRASRWRVA
jgi:hypothetical protein